MFKDTKNGQTHYYGDGCKPPHRCPEGTCKRDFGNVCKVCNLDMKNICEHEWIDCPAGICTSDCHTHHCKKCGIHSHNPSPSHIEGIKKLLWEKIHQSHMSNHADESDIKEFIERSLLSTEKNFADRLVNELEEMKLTAKNKAYDGNILESACRAYCISAESWTEIIRYENGHNAAVAEAQEKILNLLNKDK